MNNPSIFKRWYPRAWYGEAMLVSEQVWNIIYRRFCHFIAASWTWRGGGGGGGGGGGMGGWGWGWGVWVGGGGGMGGWGGGYGWVGVGVGVWVGVGVGVWVGGGGGEWWGRWAMCIELLNQKITLPIHFKYQKFYANWSCEPHAFSAVSNRGLLFMPKKWFCLSDPTNYSRRVCMESNICWSCHSNRIAINYASNTRYHIASIPNWPMKT